jgi:hypothetical protein
MLFGTSVSKATAGKFTETWAYWDVLDLMHQVGAAQEIQIGVRA